MKLTVNRETLQQLVGLAGSLCPARGPKPILRCLRLEATGDLLLVQGADGDRAMSLSTAACDIASKGVACLPNDKLASVINALDGDALTIETTGDDAVVSAGVNRFTVRGLPVAEFPAIPSAPDTPSISVTPSDLASIIEGVSYCVPNVIGRYSIMAMHLWSQGGTLYAEATTGSAAAQKTCACGGSATIKVLLAKSYYSTLQRLLALHPESASLWSVEGRMFVSLDGGESGLSAMLVGCQSEGTFPSEFPDVLKVCTGGSIHIQAQRTELMRAVRGAALMTDAQGGASRSIRVSAKDNSITIEAASSEAGDAHLSLKATIEGGEKEFSCLPDVLLSSLDSTELDTVTLLCSETPKSAIGLLLGEHHKGGFSPTFF